MGPQGPAGNDGLDGATGPMGPQGPAGNDGVDGATGPMGPQGPAGNDGLDGATGPMGPQGPQGTAGEVSIKSFVGAANTVAAGSGAFVFVGPTAEITLTETRVVFGAAQAPLGSDGADASLTTLPFFYDLCFSDGGSPEPFAGVFSPEGDPDVRPLSWAAAGAITLTAGTYDVGFCVMNSGVLALDLVSNVSGWVQVGQVVPD